MLQTLDFKGVLDDCVFKYLFHIEYILEDLTNSFFKYIIENKRFYFTEVLTQRHIIADKKDLKSFYGDVIATLNTGEFVIFEAYKSFGRREYAKSYSYMSRLYSNQVKRNENTYENNKKVMCLNFMTGNYRNVNNELINRYVMENKQTHDMLDNGETEMVLIRLDKLKDIPYTDNEERFIKWLRFISAKTTEELEKIAGGDEIMQESVEYVKWYLNSEHNTSFEDMIAEREEKATKKSLIKTAKNMLQDGLSTKHVSKYTGLSKREIDKLKKGQ